MRPLLAPLPMCLVAATLAGLSSDLRAEDGQNRNRTIVIHITASGIDPEAGRQVEQLEVVGVEIHGCGVRREG